MQPLRSPPIPALLAFNPPPPASVHCPPPITPTTPPPNDYYPSLPPASHPSHPPHPPHPHLQLPPADHHQLHLPPSDHHQLPHSDPRSPYAQSSLLTFCTPPSHTVDPPSIPSSIPPHHSFTLSSPHSLPLDATSVSLHQSTPKRRRTAPSHVSSSDPPSSSPTTASSPTPPTSATRPKKSRTPSSKYAHGLKDFTTTVATKLRFYGSASYTSVADELVNDAFARLRTENLPFNEPEVDKNVRRRVYDALNVFSSMGFVTRTGKTVVWNGKDGFLRMVGMSPCGCREPRHTCILARIDTQKRHNADLNAKIKEKRARLEELRRQEEYVQCIVRRNASKDASRLTTGSDVRVADDLEFKRPDIHRVDLPFIMVSAPVETAVSVEMEHGKESIVLDFDGAFRLWDGYSIAGRVVKRGHACGGVLYDARLQPTQRDAVSARNE